MTNVWLGIVHSTELVLNVGRVDHDKDVTM